MFDLFKNKEIKPFLAAPVEGKCIPLEEVPDSVFAEKMMGDGLAFIPNGDEFCAPCDGTVTLISVTKHAFGMINDKGVEILVHIGLDTVNFKGKGFKVLVDINKKVKKGTPIIEIDREFFESNNCNLTTPMIITNSNEYTLEYFKIGEEVQPKWSNVIKYSSKTK